MKTERYCLKKKNSNVNGALTPINMLLLRWSQNQEWETCLQGFEFGWMKTVEPVMQLYTEATDGSSIERKESALVWQYRDADPGFGSSQAKEMLDHLESVLANEPVAVKNGQFIVEVKPQVHVYIDSSISTSAFPSLLFSFQSNIYFGCFVLV